MALMDMARITPLLSVLPRLLAIDGRFVFSVTHPVFNSGDAHPTGERVRRDRRVCATEVSMKVTDYLTPRCNSTSACQVNRSTALLSPPDERAPQRVLRLRPSVRSARGAGSAAEFRSDRPADH